MTPVLLRALLRLPAELLLKRRDHEVHHRRVRMERSAASSGDAATWGFGLPTGPMLRWSRVPWRQGATEDYERRTARRGGSLAVSPLNDKSTDPASNYGRTAGQRPPHRRARRQRLARSSPPAPRPE